MPVSPLNVRKSPRGLISIFRIYFILRCTRQYTVSETCMRFVNEFCVSCYIHVQKWQHLSQCRC